MNGLRALAASALLGATLAAGAETRYVTDRLAVAVRAHPGRDAPVVRIVTSDTALEVTGRQGAFAQVRLEDGTQGWMEAIYLTATPTAARRLAELRAQPPAPPRPAPRELPAAPWRAAAVAGIAGLLLGALAGYLAHRQRARARLYGLDL